MGFGIGAGAREVRSVGEKRSVRRPPPFDIEAAKQSDLQCGVERLELHLVELEMHTFGRESDRLLSAGTGRGTKAVTVTVAAVGAVQWERAHPQHTHTQHTT